MNLKIHIAFPLCEEDLDLKNHNQKYTYLLLNISVAIYNLKHIEE